MRMPDVNILIYAHRREAHHHKFYRAWIEQLVSGPEPFALSPLVAVAFVRIVTLSSFRPMPTTLLQALTVVDEIMASEFCCQPEVGTAHWSIVRRLCESSKATGKLVADAQHAALALEHGCTWVTRDTDFEKFKKCGLRVELLEP